MPVTHNIFLVPGFFGFVNLGELLYFAHVRDYLEELCRQKGVSANLHALDTHPTASIRIRTALLAEAVSRLADESGPIHLIGHSSGGLDTRLIATPGVSLATELNVEELAERIETVVTISTPHRGTPLAGFFSTVFGKQILKMASVSTASILRIGHVPLRALLKFGGLLMRLDDKLGWTDTIGDQIFEQLLGDLSRENREHMREFLQDLSIDQALFTQLTEDGADLFNAATQARDSVYYGCVVTRARTPSWGSMMAVGLDPYAQSTHAVFMALEQIARRSKRGFPPLTAEQEHALRQAYGHVPDEKASDGVVPTRSQVWGPVIHAARADHLDTIGHFSEPGHKPPHYDWMASGSGFNRAAFDALWNDVLRFIVRT